jgi:signal transduction histidine kinase
MPDTFHSEVSVHARPEVATSMPELAAAKHAAGAGGNAEHQPVLRDAASALLALGDANKDPLAILVHELRSHIAPIKNASELLRRPTITPAAAMHAAAIIERQLEGMTRLVDELLPAATSKGLRPKLRCAETAVQVVVERTLEIVEPLVSARRQTLLLHLPEEPIRIAGDEMWLTQALQNVIGNAAKYTDPGGKIEVDVERDAVDVVISVRDTGIGLAPHQLAAVFDLYAQVAQPATRPAVGGLGVGLNVAASVVEAHGGSIRATSEGLGHGTTFVIRLPCAA